MSGGEDLSYRVDRPSDWNIRPCGNHLFFPIYLRPVPIDQSLYHHILNPASLEIYVNKADVMKKNRGHLVFSNAK